MKSEEIYILVGCEESQAVTIAFRALGFYAYSCDLKPCSGGHPEWHMQGDIFAVLQSRHWDVGIFFPDCTYLTCSAEWAYKDGPHHQKVKLGTLVGAERRTARQEAKRFFLSLWSLPLKYIAIENPIGHMSGLIKPAQIVHPYMFGDDASKSTCLWLKGFPVLKHQKENWRPPRTVNGKNRWANQTDSGQNRLSPDPFNKKGQRAELRSKTYPGIAAAMASQWGDYLIKALLNE